MTAQREAELARLNDEVRACPLCDLSKTRKRAVPGEGPVDAEIMFIGEAPGYHENEQGRPFIGQAGRFLDELLASIDLDRGKVYITNVVKCRPPNNRDPLPHEIEACAPYLERQLALIKPRVVVTLGRFSMAKFFPGAMISRIHGQPKRIGDTFYFPMYHPAAALRSDALRPVMTTDMQKIPSFIADARSLSETHGETGSHADTEEVPKQLCLFD